MRDPSVSEDDRLTIFNGGGYGLLDGIRHERLTTLTVSNSCHQASPSSLCHVHTDAGMLVVAAQPGTPDPTGRHGRWLPRLRSGARYPPIAIIPAGRPDQVAAPNNGPMALSTSNYRSVRPSA
jgi:hypothetical protein